MSADRPRAARRMPGGFAARLAAAISALIAVVCAAQSWILVRSDLDHVRAHLTARGGEVVAWLAREGAAAMGGDGVRSLKQLAEQAQAQGGVVYTRFFDRRGLLLVSVGKPPPGATPLPARPASAARSEPVLVGPALWEFQTPIRAGSPARMETVGTVAVGISIETLDALRSSAFRRAATYATLFVVLALLAAVVLARAVTRPLTALAQASDRIAGGDFATRVAVTGDDELARLARSFNAMVQSLATSRAAIEEKVRELEEANHLKSEFLATVSHELRTPLNVIIGYAEMLADGAGGPLSDAQQEMVAAIQRYSCLQRDLITNVLDFSRLNSGRVSMHVEPFTLPPLLEEVQALYRDQLRDRPVELVVRLEEPAPAMETDRIKLQEVVRNLVDNAIKFTERGTVTVTAGPDPEPGWLALTVADTGTGIPPDELGSIFEAFRQIGDSRTRQTGGVGLGLSIVHRLVGVLGGTVTAESRPGEGSTFRVRVPARLNPPAPAEAAEAALDATARNAAAVRLSAPPSPSAAASPGRTDRAG